MSTGLESDRALSISRDQNIIDGNKSTYEEKLD